MDHLGRTAKQIGSVIRRARKARGLTQAGLGAKVGLRQATISRIETGNPEAQLETILKILAALDLEFRVTARSRGGGADLEDIF